MNKLSRNKQSFQYALDQNQVKRDQEISRLMEMVVTVKSKSKNYKAALMKEESELERKRLNHKIILLDQRKQKLMGRLKQLGHEDKRGRPKKVTAETYKGQRIKFTAHLLPENMEYLKQLKGSNKVDNISSYLDELIQMDRERK